MNNKFGLAENKFGLTENNFEVRTSLTLLITS